MTTQRAALYARFSRRAVGKEKKESLMRRFFYVSLGVLALALAFQLGARVARSSPEVDEVDCIELAHITMSNSSSVPRLTIVTNGRVQWWGYQLQQQELYLSNEAALPRSGPLADAYISDYEDIFWLVYPDGDVWTWNIGGNWRRVGNVCGGTAGIPEPELTPSTWGQIKARASQGR